MIEELYGSKTAAFEAGKLVGQAGIGVDKQIAEAVRAERSACLKIAAEYGGHDAEQIAEQIGKRNFV